MPKNRPTAVETTKPATTDQVSMALGSGVNQETILASNRPPVTPQAPPTTAMVADSIRNCMRMSARRAPMDFRRPISLVRSLTETSMMFMITIPPTSISLLVGGIVIMNIMLVSVSERTREIGLRKSIGARRADIRMQFLIESATIAVVGGACGVTGGLLLAKMVSWLTPLPSAIETWSVVAGLVVSTAVGLFFGIYPASKAARLDPVEALRAE